MQQVHCPPNRLPVGGDEIEVIEPVSVSLVPGACHHPMHSKGADRKPLLHPCRLQNVCDGGPVIDFTNEHAQYVLLGDCAHDTHLSSFMSKISLRMSSTLYFTRHSG